ncbi:Phospholipase A2 isozymes PA3A/PA3B/PA5 [Lucilia cuprina]|nr:Phospholipase A2 isozymes PA3A/PA3B/PA5 [Lucilia cuprina]
MRAFEESILKEDIYRTSLTPSHPTTGITAPGTKWCGPGNTSTSYNDLGTQRETDMCVVIMIINKIYISCLNNSDWFPILKCSCEQKFINCLKKRQNLCIAEAILLSVVTVYGGTFRKRCIRIMVDKKT